MRIIKRNIINLDNETIKNDINNTIDNNTKIDILITFVDSSSKIWQEKYNSYINTINKNDLCDKSNNTIRFKSS
jgi:hypothetical protein